MIAALTKPRRPSYYHALMFRILVTVALFGLFWSSVPARTMTADALDQAALHLRP